MRRIVCVAAALVALSGCRSGGARNDSGVFKELTAERLRIVDSEGRPRVYMGEVKDKGYSALSVLDQEGKVRLVVILLADGSPLVALNDGDEHVGVGLGLGASKGGTAFLSFRDKNEKDRLALGVDQKDGSASVTLTDSSEKRRVVIEVDGKDAASLTVKDKDEKPVFKAP
ncbi:hypothetical protein HY251_07005 [bacterium]|nr:hypothetical protein [bacterium]